MSTDAQDVFWTQRAESEERLVACMSSNPDRILDVCQIVKQEDFVNPFYATWFRLAADLGLAGTFTQDRLRSQLRRAGYLKDPGETSLFGQLCREPISGADAVWHATEIARIAALVKIKRECQGVLVSIDDLDVNPEKTIEALIAKLEAIGCRQADLWEDAGSVAERVYETHRRNSEQSSMIGVSTGFPSIDRITGGFFPGQLWHIAARSYMGKSTVALAFAYNQIAYGRGCYFASYEMTNDELMERLMADKTGTVLSRFTMGGIQPEELARVKVSSEQFRSLPMFMDDRPPASVQQLRARIKLAGNTKKIDLVVVDHLGLFPHVDRRVPRFQQLVEITRELKQMAKELDLTVLILNQLNADADGEKPTDKNIAESKGILSNLDVSILLHRKDKTCEDMNCNVTKNRKGKPEECTLIFEGEIQRITDPCAGQAWNGSFIGGAL